MKGEVTEYECLGRWEITEMEGNGLIEITAWSWLEKKKATERLAHRPDSDEGKGGPLHGNGAPSVRH